MRSTSRFRVTDRVVAVVVTRNRPELLGLSLDALRAQTRSLQDIVVVDNASDAETVSLLDSASDLTVLRLDCNTGGSGGFAAGVTRALDMESDWIWLLDDDVVLHETALERLLDAPGDIDDAAEGLAALCSAVEEGGRLALMHRRHFDPATLCERVVPRRHYRRAAVSIDIASFVGLLVRTDVIRHVGLPDARFFISYDDTEFSLRLRRAGYRIWLVPASLADHRRCLKTRLRHGPFGIRHYFNLRNRLIVYRKFGSDAPTWRWLRPLVQSLLLLVVAGRGRSAAFGWWWRAWCDSRAEPFPDLGGRQQTPPPEAVPQSHVHRETDRRESPDKPAGRSL